MQEIQQEIHAFGFNNDIALSFLQFLEPKKLRMLNRHFASKYLPKSVNISGFDAYQSYIKYCHTFHVTTIEEVRASFWRRSYFDNAMYQDYIPIGWTPASVKKLTIYSDYCNDIIIGENIEILTIESSHNNSIVIPDNVREIYISLNFKGTITRWPETEYELFEEEETASVTEDGLDYDMSDYDDFWD